MIVQNSTDPYVRPSITPMSANDNMMILISARHPIITNPRSKLPTHSFVPNDCIMGPMNNVHIITGPNTSGKVRIVLYRQ